MENGRKEYPTPSSDDERNDAIDKLAEKMVNANFSPEAIEKIGLSNLIADYAMDISNWYPAVEDSGTGNN